MHSLQEGTGPRFNETPLKTTENLGLGPPICPLFWESLDPPPVYFEKNIYIRLRPKLGNTYYHIILFLLSSKSISHPSSGTLAKKATCSFILTWLVLA
jgi:hypothetical protein